MSRLRMRASDMDVEDIVRRTREFVETLRTGCPTAFIDIEFLSGTHTVEDDASHNFRQRQNCTYSFTLHVNGGAVDSRSMEPL